MDDKQLVEVWRAEFHKIMSRDRPFNSIEFLPRTTTYADEETFNLWFGFLMAKRSQPSVELPKGHLMDDPDGMGRGRYLMIESVERAITRAGYNYEVKE